MASEHEHDWMYVTDMATPTPEPGYIVTNAQPIIRFCTRCDARQSLSPVGIVAEYHRKNLELEQQLSEAQKENERLRTRDAEWTESNAKAVTRYAEARWLLEWLLPLIEGNEWLTMSDAADDKAAQRESYRAREEAVEKIRAFLSK